MKYIFSIVCLCMFCGICYANNNINLVNDFCISPDSGLIYLPSPNFITSSRKMQKSFIAFTCVAPMWKNITEQQQFNTSFNNKVVSKRMIEFNGDLKTWDGSFDLKQNVNIKDDESFDCSWYISNKQGIDCESVFSNLKLSSSYEGTKLVVGGKEIVLPPFTKTHKNIHSFSNIDRIIFPTHNGKITISGNLSGMLMVSAEHSTKYYGLRLFASSHKGKIESSSVKFNIKFDKISSFPLDINEAANSCFKDETPEDKKGGWTDQGREYDLRSLTPGMLTLGGIDFKVINPSENNDKSCIVLKGAARDYFPASAATNVTGNFKKIYLLHASAWNLKNKKAGSINITYNDDTSEKIPVVCGIDIGDWAKGIILDNAVPIWNGDSIAFGNATLYLSEFNLKNKELKKITFESGEGPIWMIVAASLSKDSITPLREISKSVEYIANKNWIAIDWKPLSTLRGSAFDLSAATEMPAGKHGDVYCSNDNFSFKGAPKKQLRFFGCNITHELPYMSKKQTEQFADQLSMLGYNAVRFHCYIKGMSKNDGSPELNIDGMDKFCYMLYCLKKRGIYYSFPLNGNTGWGNVVINDSQIPEFCGKIKMTHLEGLTPVSDIAMQWVKDFAKNLLLYTNPYTNSAIKDDPALISVELQNESSLYAIFHRFPIILEKVYNRKCSEYLKTKNKSIPSDNEVKEFLPKFIALMQKKGSQELMAYLRNIGVKKPITDISCGIQMALELTRENFDYIDIHSYWDLAEGLPSYPHMRNPISGKWSSQLGAGACRIFGKPFAMGEYNTVYPSPYWSYMVPSEAIIAGLQNWGMIQSFMMDIYIKELFASVPAIGVKSNNPMIQMTERIGAMLFKNGLVKPSKVKIPFVITREYINQNLDRNGAPSYPRNYFDLGLCCQIGTVIYEKGMDLSCYPCVVIPEKMEIPDSMNNIKYFRADNSLHDNIRTILPGLGKNEFKSTTGQVVLNSQKKIFSVITSGAECFMLPEDQSDIRGDFFSVAKNFVNSTSFVGALDNINLENSKHLFALYITDLKNTGTVIKSTKNGGFVFQTKGRLPFLLRQSEATFSIKTKNSELPQVWALKYNGARGQLINVNKTNSGFSFVAKAITSKDTYFAYEIIWK